MMRVCVNLLDDNDIPETVYNVPLRKVHALLCKARENAAGALLYQIVPGGVVEGMIASHKSRWITLKE